MSSSLLSRFQRTNDAPSEREVLEVQGISQQARDDLNSVEARLRVLQLTPGFESTVQTLRRDGASLRQRIQLCRSILSPIRRITPEILAHIFVCTMPTIQEARAVNWYTALERSPWVLGQISRRWRAVVLASPALWSSIIIRNTHGGN
ncbi:hypothetical protein C8R44DRAFT_600585, partial [Mycena epipterygia]